MGIGNQKPATWAPSGPVAPTDSSSQPTGVHTSGNRRSHALRHRCLSGWQVELPPSDVRVVDPHGVLNERRCELSVSM